VLAVLLRRYRQVQAVREFARSRGWGRPRASSRPSTPDSGAKPPSVCCASRASKRRACRLASGLDIAAWLSGNARPEVAATAYGATSSSIPTAGPTWPRPTSGWGCCTCSMASPPRPTSTCSAPSSWSRRPSRAARARGPGHHRRAAAARAAPLVASRPDGGWSPISRTRLFSPA